MKAVAVSLAMMCSVARAEPAKPRPCVQLVGAIDSATGDKLRAEVARAALERTLRTSPHVAVCAAEAKAIDLAVTKLVTEGREIVAEIKLTVSDHDGKLLAFVTSGARVTCRHGDCTEDAIANAASGVSLAVFHALP